MVKYHHRQNNSSMNSNSILQTSPNFKSVDENVHNIDTIKDIVGYAIDNQKYFEKTTTPWDSWKGKNIQDFKIELEKIDRLYYIFGNELENEYNLVCRMQGEFYIQMIAYCCNFSPVYSDGSIFVSRDANLFMKVVLPNNPHYNKTLIYESLRGPAVLRGYFFIYRVLSMSLLSVIKCTMWNYMTPPSSPHPPKNTPHPPLW